MWLPILSQHLDKGVEETKRELIEQGKDWKSIFVDFIGVPIFDTAGQALFEIHSKRTATLRTSVGLDYVCVRTTKPILANSSFYFEGWPYNLFLPLIYLHHNSTRA